MNRFDAFFVKSPFQYLSARNALALTKSKVILFVLYSEPFKSESSKQLYEIIDTALWSEVIHLSLLNRVERWRSISKIYRLLSKKFIKRVFIGEFRDVDLNILAHKLTPKKYLIDDGATTIFIQNDFIAKKNSFFFEHLALSSKIFCFCIHYFFPTKEMMNQRFNLITEFDLLPSKNYPQAILSTPVKKIICNKVLDEIWFFGSKYSEDKIMSQEDEFNYVRFSIEYMKSNFSMPVIYIPHRAESEAKLNFFSDLGVMVRPLKKPVEKFIADERVKPKVIAAGWSTILTTLPNRTDFECMLCFKIPLDKISHSVKNRAKVIYNYYKMHKNIGYVLLPDSTFN